jgi:hypothetical protein
VYFGGKPNNVGENLRLPPPIDLNSGENSHFPILGSSQKIITNADPKNYFSNTSSKCLNIASLSERFSALSCSAPVFIPKWSCERIKSLNALETKVLLQEALKAGNLNSKLQAIEKAANGAETLRCLFSIWAIRSDPLLAMACLIYERSSSLANRIFTTTEASSIICEFQKIDPEIRKSLLEKSVTEGKDIDFISAESPEAQMISEKLRIIDSEHKLLERTRQMLGKTATVIMNVIARSKDSDLSPIKMRIYWQLLAEDIAKYCFENDGQISINKVSSLVVLLRDEKIFTNPPYSQILNIDFIFTQILRTLTTILDSPEDDSKNELRKILNDAKSFAVVDTGQAALKAVSSTAKPLTPGEAILQALFFLHRQFGLPTCTIDSYINTLLHNAPEQIAKFCQQILTKGYISFPSGFHCLPFIVKFINKTGFVLTDLKNGINDQTVNIFSRSQDEGIIFKAYASFQIPAMSLISVIFGSILQSTFGNFRINNDCTHGTLRIFNGIKSSMVNNSYFRTYESKDYSVAGIVEGLRASAQELRQKYPNLHYMRINTSFDGSLHDENVDVDRLLNIDLNQLRPDEFYPFIDHNWIDSTSGEISMLAIKNSTTGFEFVTVGGANVKSVNITQISIYPIEINYNTWNNFANYRSAAKK